VIFSLTLAGFTLILMLDQRANYEGNATPSDPGPRGERAELHDRLSLLLILLFLPTTVAP